MATYKDAGVDIAAGEEAVERIKAKVQSTFRPEVIGGIGGFGGLFAMPDGYRDPVLVAGTDTVGTKALIAAKTGRFDTIGLDLVAMCVDDIVCQGAEPLFLLDCISIGKLVPEHIEQLVEGVAEGCRRAGCTLLGGEMAENPGLFPEGEFDLAGFAVGVVERDRLITGENVRPGDVLVGLHSPGLRCNGYSLARRVLLDLAGRSFDEPAYEGATHSLADELREPSVIYAPAIVRLLREVDVHGLAHVTGGGIPGNVVRVLPGSVDAVVRRSSWETPRIFDEIQRLGDIADDEMARVFNLGIGMVVVVPPDDVFRTLDVLRTEGHRAAEIGEIVEGEGRVQLTGMSAATVRALVLAACIGAVGVALAVAWTEETPELSRAEARSFVQDAFGGAGFAVVKITQQPVIDIHRPGASAGPEGIEAWRVGVRLGLKERPAKVWIHRTEGRAVKIDEGKRRFINRRQFRALDEFAFTDAVDRQERRQVAGTVASLLTAAVAVAFIANERRHAAP